LRRNAPLKVSADLRVRVLIQPERIQRRPDKRWVSREPSEVIDYAVQALVSAFDGRLIGDLVYTFRREDTFA
jgi:hypothetical protein